MSKIVTTSWDDGHPKDFVISELMEKYNIKGTFYIPKNNAENEVMNEEQVRQLSTTHEIGGHTLNHLKLTVQNTGTINFEVNGCFNWLKSILQKDPVSFCFPLGAYNNEVISSVKKAGFKILRTTELLSVSSSRAGALVPTTLQLYEHSGITYFRHLVKRFKFTNMLLWLQNSSNADILKLTEYYINYILKHDGCFHLWGHSWEIEKFGLWKKLELIFKQLNNISEFQYLQNKDIY